MLNFWPAGIAKTTMDYFDLFWKAVTNANFWSSVITVLNAGVPIITAAIGGFLAWFLRKLSKKVASTANVLDNKDWIKESFALEAQSLLTELGELKLKVSSLEVKLMAETARADGFEKENKQLKIRIKKLEEEAAANSAASDSAKPKRLYRRRNNKGEKE